jgi:hypothetical protein
LKSNQNITNLASFLALWDLFWEKIIVLQDADGTVCKCDVELKLSRKTTVDLVCGRYDVVGYKRGVKPYKKFRDSGMIELILKENIIQSEVLDVTADVEQPAPKKEEQKRRTLAKKAKAAELDAARVNSNSDVELLMDDLITLAAGGHCEYTTGIAAILIEGIIDEIEASWNAGGSVFMEGPLVDLRSLPWEAAIMAGNPPMSPGDRIGKIDSVWLEYDGIRERNTLVAQTIDDIITSLENLQVPQAHQRPRATRPMSSGVCLSLVMETLLQALETEELGARSRNSRFRLDGPLVDLRSLPWETAPEVLEDKSPKPQSFSALSAGKFEPPEIHVQNICTLVNTCDLTGNSEGP